MYIINYYILIFPYGLILNIRRTWIICQIASGHPSTKNPSAHRRRIVPCQNLKIETLMTEGRGLQCGAPKIAKLVYNSNNYGLWYL